MKVKAEVPEGIKSGCLGYFLTKETFNFIMNIAAPVIIMFIGAVITYGITDARGGSAQAQEITALKAEVNTLQSQINNKLDTLLKRKEAGEK